MQDLWCACAHKRNRIDAVHLGKAEPAEKDDDPWHGVQGLDRPSGGLR